MLGLSAPYRTPGNTASQYGSFTAHRKAVRFILRTVNMPYCQLKAPFGRQPKGTSGGIPYAFPLCFMVLFLYISFIFYGFIKVNYRGYIQAVLFFRYRQCIIIALVVQRNFLYISFVFYSFISYIFLYFTVLFLISFIFYGFI